MRPSSRLLLLLVLGAPAFLASSTFRAQDPDDEQEAREQAFAELLTGARLTGFFTLDGQPDAPPSKDSYTITMCEPMGDGTWKIESLMEYGGNSISVPLFLPVKWAGDTPVITVDQVKIHGGGTYDARVLFHGTSYAGVWRGADYGGGMVGRIERAKKESPEGGK